MVRLPAEAKRDLEAAISAAGGSDDPGVYLGAFKDLGSKLFDAEADAREDVAQGPDSLQRTLIDDLVPIVVESIFRDLGSVLEIGSDQRKSVPSKHELATGTLSELQPSGEWGPPSLELQGCYAGLSYWEEYAPAVARLALFDSPKMYGEFREALRQHLERQALKQTHRFRPAPVSRTFGQTEPTFSASERGEAGHSANRIHEGSMQYRPEFSDKARAAVEAELIRAVRLHDDRKREWESDWVFPERESLRQAILSVFLIFAGEAVELGKEGVWSVDQVRKVALEGLWHIIFEISSKGDYHSFIDSHRGEIWPETKREFEATAEWRRYEDALSDLAERCATKNPQQIAAVAQSAPFQGIVGGERAQIPALSDSTKRKLAVQWDTIRDKQKLTDEDVSGYDRERQRLLRVAAKWPRNDRRHRDPRYATQRARWLGVTSSVQAAEARFRGIVSEYWQDWCCSGCGYEVCQDWLNSIKRRVIADFAAIWKGRSDATDRWFQDMCTPAIDQALGALVKQRVAQARDVEVQRLEHAPGSAHSPTGNPILDEIDAGGDNLSPAARKALELAGLTKEQVLQPTRMVIAAGGAIESGVTPVPTPPPPTVNNPAVERVGLADDMRQADASGSSVPRPTVHLQAPHLWRALRKEFDDLAARQQSILGNPPHDRWLGAYCSFSKTDGEFGNCRRKGGLDGRLLSDFDDVATRAACSLGCPADVEPVKYWLYLLGQDLLNSSETAIRGELSPRFEGGGFIQGLLESSAAYCSRLAARAQREANGAQSEEGLALPDTKSTGTVMRELKEQNLAPPSVPDLPNGDLPGCTNPYSVARGVSVHGPRPGPTHDSESRPHKESGASGESGQGLRLKSAKRRGRRPNTNRRDAIRCAMKKHGDEWRDHIDEVFAELDSNAVPLGDFEATKIDVGENESTSARTWTDLDLAEGKQRKQIIDALRKYFD